MKSGHREQKYIIKGRDKCHAKLPSQNKSELHHILPNNHIVEDCCIALSLEYIMNPCRQRNFVSCRLQKPTELGKQRFNDILNVWTILELEYAV